MERSGHTISYISEPLQHVFIGGGERAFLALEELYLYCSLTLSCPAWTLHSAECGYHLPACTAHAVFLRRRCTACAHIHTLISKQSKYSLYSTERKAQLNCCITFFFLVKTAILTNEISFNLTIFSNQG